MMKLEKCINEYWEFVRKLRLDERVKVGFLDNSYISEQQQIDYMKKYWKQYYIILYNSKPAGYVGVVNNDIRICTHPDFQGKGVGKFMLNEINKIYPNALAKVKKKNTASNRLFLSTGFQIFDNDDEFNYFKKIKQMINIPFSKPFLTNNEISYISNVLDNKKLSGNGDFTKKCHHLFNEYYGFENCLLTSSCTDALEMAAILIDIHPGDEVIMPSYTFVSTANAFILRGAKILFVDSRKDSPGIDEDKIEELITSKTKAIVPVHYAGISCDMDKIMGIAKKYDLFVIEDAAQSIDSYYIDKNGNKTPLGSFGDLAAFSFHETKNIISGEGGMLVINNEKFKERAEIIWEKGTNRSAFFRGEVNKYGWVDLGSSFLPSEITAAFLYAQLEQINKIQKRRLDIWNLYYERLSYLSSKFSIQTSFVPHYSTNNGHIFYIVCNTLNERTDLIDYLKQKGILAVFHYLSLHKSDYFEKLHDTRSLVQSDRYSDCLLRLPLYNDLELTDVNLICSEIINYFESKI